jgi:hypothetical protein
MNDHDLATASITPIEHRPGRDDLVGNSVMSGHL